MSDLNYGYLPGGAILAAALICAAPCPADEVLRLTFENASNLAEDTSSNAFTGAIEQLNFGGSITQSANVPVGVAGSSSASFSPADFENGPYISFKGAEFPDFTPDDSFTVSLWVNPTTAWVEDTQGFRAIVSGLSTTAFTSVDWQLDNGDAADPGTDSVSGLNSNARINLGSELVGDQWQKVTLSYNSAGRSVAIFLDSSLSVAEGKASGLSMEDFLVGVNRNETILYEGLIDELQVFDTASVVDAGGVRRDLGDLDFNGTIDSADWTAFKGGQGADLSGSGAIPAYQQGDMDLDGDNDLADFLSFKAIYNDIHGEGALAQLIASAPEPASGLLLASAGVGLLMTRRRRNTSIRRPAFARSKTDLAGKVECIVIRKLSLGCFAVGLILFSNSLAQAQTTVFSAAFEGLTQPAADTGTLSFTGPGVQSIVSVDGSASHTDWGTNALWADRSASSGGAQGFTMSWDFTDPVDLNGATIDFDYILRRTNTGNVKSHFVNGLDSNGATVFSLFLIDREDSGLANIDPDYTEPAETNERQRQTVGFIDPTAGQSLFPSSSIATGSIPDSNDRSGGTNDFEFFFGNDNRDDPVSEEQAGLFSVTTSPTGWTLNATPRQSSTLSAFTTTEQSFFDSGVIDLAKIEVIGETVQAGGYWDNLSVQGTVVDPPTPLKLQVLSNGQMKLVGGDPGGGVLGLDIDYISITSEDVEEDGGSLNPTGFTGLGGDSGFPAGDGSGNGWEFGDNNSDKIIIESYLEDSSFISNEAEIMLGTGYVPGGAQDISFTYHIVGETTETVGLVEYVPVAGLPGDFNDDGVVDAADYTVYRDNLGQSDAALNGNGTGDVSGLVVLADYDLWRTSYGSSASQNAAAQATPEPSTMAALATLLLATGGFRRVR